MLVPMEQARQTPGYRELEKLFRQSDYFLTRPKQIREAWDKYPPYLIYKYNGQPVAIMGMSEHDCGHVTGIVGYLDWRHEMRDDAELFSVELEQLTRLGWHSEFTAEDQQAHIHDMGLETREKLETFGELYDKSPPC